MASGKLAILDTLQLLELAGQIADYSSQGGGGAGGGAGGGGGGEGEGGGEEEEEGREEEEEEVVSQSRGTLVWYAALLNADA